MLRWTSWAGRPGCKTQALPSAVPGAGSRTCAPARQPEPAPQGPHSIPGCSWLAAAAAGASDSLPVPAEMPGPAVQPKTAVPAQALVPTAAGAPAPPSRRSGLAEPGLTAGARAVTAPRAPGA